MHLEGVGRQSCKGRYFRWRICGANTAAMWDCAIHNSGSWHSHHILWTQLCSQNTIGMARVATLGQKSKTYPVQNLSWREGVDLLSRCKSSEGRDWVLFVLDPQSFVQCLAHIRYLIHISQMNELYFNLVQIPPAGWYKSGWDHRMVITYIFFITLKNVGPQPQNCLPSKSL